MSIAETYKKQKTYKDKGYPSSGKTPFDFWYERLYYGRVDLYLNTINTAEGWLLGMLKTTGPGQKYFAIDFVAEAFNDLRAFLRKKITSKHSTFYNLNPRKGYVDINHAYDAILKEIYTTFVIKADTYFLRSKDKMKSFESFLPIFLEHLNMVISRIPITKTGYTLSYLNSILSTGLAVEIEKIDYNDSAKRDRFLKDPHFNFYRTAAEAFGFKIDKYIPWRLIADLKSPKMQAYMAPHGVSFENVFSKVFYPTHLDDIGLLKNYFFNFYTTFIEEYPMVQEYVDCPNKPAVSAGLTSSKYIVGKKPNVFTDFREPLLIEDYEKNYSSVFWIKTYASIRAKESKAPISEKHFHSIVKKAKKINLMFDFDTAITYINDVMKQHWISEQLRTKGMIGGVAGVSGKKGTSKSPSNTMGTSPIGGAGGAVSDY